MKVARALRLRPLVARAGPRRRPRAGPACGPGGPALLALARAGSAGVDQPLWCFPKLAALSGSRTLLCRGPRGPRAPRDREAGRGLSR